MLSGDGVVLPSDGGHCGTTHIASSKTSMRVVSILMT